MSSDNIFSDGNVLPENYMSPAPAGKRKSGRRSWFTPSKQIRLEIAVDPHEQKQVQHVEKDEIELLTLTHFTKPPKIDFGTVRVGKTCVRKLCASNPHDYTQQVVVEKFPFDKNFTTDLTEFFVQPGENQMIELTWSPKEEGNQRQMILFKVEGVIRLQAFLIGKAEVPAKPKKRKTWKPPKTVPLITLQPSASIRAKQIQASKKSQDNSRTEAKKSSSLGKSQSSKLQNGHMKKSSKLSSRRDFVEDKENTPPHPRYSMELHRNERDDDDDDDLNKSTLQRSLTYSKLNQSFSPSPKLSGASGPNSRRGSNDTKRASKESMFSVYEDCMQTLSRRPSYESVVSVYEDCPPPDSRRPSKDDVHPPMSLDELVCSTRKSEENRRLSKESIVSVYEDASEYLESPVSDEYDDSLMVAPDKENTCGGQQNTPNKNQSGFSRDILVESYEVVEQVEEEIITEEVKVTQTKIMSDSYEITTDVNVEVTRDTDARYHEQVIKETFVHVEGSPQRFFPGISSGERKFFPPIDHENKIVMHSQYNSEELHEVECNVDIRRETVVINSAVPSSSVTCIRVHSKSPLVVRNEEDFIRRETVVLSQAQSSVSSNNIPLLNTQSPTKLLPPQHVTGDTSFSPLQSRFSPTSPQADPNADPNESRRETVTMECPSPALVACHSRLIRAGHAGCVDNVDSSTPILRVRDLSNTSPKSSTPIPGRSVRGPGGMRRNLHGPSWVRDHLQEPPCSPVTRLPLDASPTSPRKALFSASTEPEARRISTQTVTKTKPAISELSPTSTRSEQSPVINTSTVTKSRSSVGQYITYDPSSKQFERTVDQSAFANCDNASNTCDVSNNSRRLSSLTVTKSAPCGTVHEAIPECTEAGVLGTANTSKDILQFEDILSDAQDSMSSFSKSINSQTRSDSKTKRRSSGKLRRSSGQSRIRSETVTKSRSSLTPPVGNCPRKRLSSKKLFSPPQNAPVMDESIKPLSPSPNKRLSAVGIAKLAARMKQDHETSLEIPIHHSKVTSNLVQNKARRSVDGSRPKKSTEQNNFRRSVDPSTCKSDASKYPKRRSFGNKTLATNVNRPATKPVVFDGSSSLKLTRTQQLRRSAAKSAVKGDSQNNMDQLKNSSSNNMRNRYQSGTSLNKSTTNRSRMASGAKGLAQSKLTLIKSKPSASAVLPKHPMPFAAKNVYYDERWMEKQERGFIKWLNFVLTPPDEYVEAKKPQKVKDAISKLIVDAGKLCLDAQSNPKLAPTKEVISFRTYAASRRLNRLRRNACKMFQTEDNAKIIKKLEIEIETRRLAVREDRKIHADLGIKQKLLDMILSYNPLWLRIGLETIFGEILPIESNVDIIGMSRFIVTRLLGNPDTAQAFAHPTVPHLYAPGYDEAIAQHILKKFLLLVHFLDHAKTTRLVDHDPCLFCKDAEFKSSRDLLLVFARDYLRGEGDLTRHLSYLGYTIKHTQTALEEFDYAVSCLATDLRDGVRLTRVIEMLSKRWALTTQMRVPAISRLQKIHNADVAFKAISEHGLDLSTSRGGKICPRDIVDGHREKTLLLLWNIIFNFQVECLIDENQLKEEVEFLRKNLQLQKQYEALLNDLDKSTSMLGLPRDRRESMEPDVYFKSPMLSLLLKWCQAVCSYYGMKVENFTVSFSDGRALCYLVHHYHPSLLKVEDVRTNTTLTYDENQSRHPGTPGSGSDDSFTFNWTTTFSPTTGKPGLFDELLANEKSNFKLLYDKVSELGGIPVMVRCADMSNTIPDEKVVITYVTYLCARLLDIRHETRAARVIQAAWRNYRNRKTKVAVEEHREEIERQKRLRAAVKIQAWWRAQEHRKQFLVTRHACLTIQQHWKARKLADKQVSEYKQLKKSVNTIQYRVRKWLKMKRMKQIQAVNTITRCWRSYWARKQIRKTVNSIVKLQALVRRYQIRKEFLAKKSATVKIQRFFRSYRLRKLDQQTFENQKKAATVIQKYVRCHLERTRFLRTRDAAVKIQATWRACTAQLTFIKMRYAATLIQSQYRAHQLSLQQRAKYAATKSATLVLQTYVRRWQAKKHVQRIRAARTIQAFFRGHVQRTKYREQRHAAVLIQAQMRMVLQRRRYLQLCSATVLLQRHIRAYQAAKSQQYEYQCRCNAATVIQAYYRGYLGRKYAQQERAARTLQSAARMCIARQQYINQLKAVLMVQKNVRMYLARNDFLRKKAAATLIQNHFRFHLLRRQIETDFQRMKRAAKWIQCWYRKVSARKYFLECKQSAIKLQTWWKMTRQRKNYLQHRNAAITIQRHFRCFQQIKKQQYEHQQRTTAACTIQSHWRRHKVRELFLQQRNSAVLIQSYYRRHLARRCYQERLHALFVLQKYARAWYTGRRQWEFYHIQRGACIVIQTKYRCWLAERAYQKVRNAAVLLQSYVRMQQARTRYLETKNAAITIQARWRVTLCARQQQRDYVLKRVAAIVVQAVYRGQRCRKALKKRRRAATVIQSCFRCHLQRQKYLRKSAAVKIQNWYRNWTVARCTKEEFCKKRNAAIQIQSHVKSFIQRRKYIHYKTSVTKVQSVIRMYQAKKRLLHKKQATITLQRQWRSVLISRQIRNQYLTQRQAAVTLQSKYRAYLARKRFSAMKHGFTQLQALVRMRSARRSYNRKVASACTLQKYIRAYLIGQQTRRDYETRIQKEASAAVVIQSIYRSYVQRRLYRETIRNIVKLQCVVRRWCAQRLLHKMKLQQRAALCILTHYRAYRLGLEERQRYIMYRAASLIIQTHFRRYRCQKNLLEARKAATTIQAKYRMFRARNEYRRTLNAAVTIQRWYSQCRNAKTQRREYLRKRSAIINIQSAFKGYMCRRHLNHLNACASKIQAGNKMYKARTNFIKQKSAVNTIQAWYHALLIGGREREQFVGMRRAAIFIQSWYRAVRCRKELRRQAESAVFIQKHVKGFLERRHFMRQRQAALFIQSFWRNYKLMHCVQTQYTKQKQAVIVIQSFVRRVVAERKYKKMRHVVVRLQSLIRMRQAQRAASRKLHAIVTIQRQWRATRMARITRSHYLAQRKACTTLQSAVRMYTARKRYNSTRTGFVRLQAAVRMRMQQQRYQKQKQAVLIIQSNLRAYCMVQRLRHACQTKKTAVTMIQTHWRAYKARHRVKQIRAAICIQAMYRCYAERKLYRHKIQWTTKLQALVRGCGARRRYKQLCVQNRAAICIQRHTRKYLKQLELKRQKEVREVQLSKIVSVTKRHLHVIRIQRCVRRYLSMKRAQEQVASIVIIQRWMRSKLERRSFLRIRNSVRVLQRIIRAWSAKKYVENIKKSATKIQAVWRGYCVRKANKSKKLTAVRQRVIEANAAATEDKKLCNRTSSALDFLLNYKQLAYILEALINLEAVTRLSPECCEQMVEGHALPVIFKLIRSCNRSIPHMELIKYSVSVLLNVAKYEKTAGAVFEVESSIDTLVEVMTHFREKGPVFTKSCTLVGILCYDTERKKEVKSMTKVVEKIQSIHKIVSRKHNMEEKRQLIKSKMAASQSFCGGLPSVGRHSRPHVIRPEWVLRRNSVHVIEDPMKAISFVMNCLNLNSK